MAIHGNTWQYMGSDVTKMKNNRHGQKLSFPSLTLKLSQVQAKSTNEQNMVDLAGVLL